MISTQSIGVSPHEKKQRQRAAKALANARQRYTNPKNKDYANYGAQGIKVLLTLDELIEAIDLPSTGLSLDRIDPSGHYEVGNVRWANKAVQASNKKLSPGGTTPPLHTLIAQAKLVVQQENMRPKVAEAWRLLLKAFNLGLSSTDAAAIAENLDLAEPVEATFGSHKVVLGGETQVIFRLPSLTTPNELVTARGPLIIPPDDGLAERYLRHGLLYRLRDVEGVANVPAPIRDGIEALRLDDDLTGLMLVGRPAKDDLLSGWFEIWMLAAASRLPKFGTSTALYPAMTCLELLDDLGGPNNWDNVEHPLLDAPMLFIPDFQLDCGSWGSLSPYQFGALERLLKYRIDMGHKTVVGVQAPHKLSAGLRKILLGGFKVHPVANVVSPLAALKFTGKPLAVESNPDVVGCDNSADDFEKCGAD